MNIEELIVYYKEYKTKLSQFQLAQLEEQIWSSQKNVGWRRKWFADNFGGIQNDYEIRASIFSYGTVAKPIWERIEKGLSLYVAVQLMRDAKKKAIQEQKFLSMEVVQNIINEYDIARTTKPRGINRKAAVETSTIAKQLKIDIQTIAEKYMDSFPNIDEYELKQLKNELIESINSSIDLINRKIYRKNSSSKINNLHMKIGRTNFIQALDILGQVSLFLENKLI